MLAAISHGRRLTIIPKIQARDRCGADLNSLLHAAQSRCPLSIANPPSTAFPQPSHLKLTAQSFLKSSLIFEQQLLGYCSGLFQG